MTSTSTGHLLENTGTLWGGGGRGSNRGVVDMFVRRGTMGILDIVVEVQAKRVPCVVNFRH